MSESPRRVRLPRINEREFVEPKPAPPGRRKRDEVPLEVVEVVKLYASQMGAKLLLQGPEMTENERDRLTARLTVLNGWLESKSVKPYVRPVPFKTHTLSSIRSATLKKRAVEKLKSIGKPISFQSMRQVCLSAAVSADQARMLVDEMVNEGLLIVTEQETKGNGSSRVVIDYYSLPNESK